MRGLEDSSNMSNFNQITLRSEIEQKYNLRNYCIFFQSFLLKQFFKKYLQFAKTFETFYNTDKT